MPIRDFNILKNLWIAFKQFLKEDGFDKSCILAYYSMFSSLFLLAFFTFIFAQFVGGDPDIAIKSVYPFSPEFFTTISPDFFQRAGQISAKIKDIGIIAIIITSFFGFLIINKVVDFVNAMFHESIEKHKSDKRFFLRRLTEFGLIFVIGIMMIGSFYFSSVVSHLSFEFYKNNVDPSFIEWMDSFLIQYLLPFIITFVFFLILYKWIPEKVVYFKGAVISAIISTILWETTKRIYAYYLVHISIFGQIKGPIIAIILFGFWMQLSMSIMLYGAKLTYVFDKEKNDNTKRFIETN